MKNEILYRGFDNIPSRKGRGGVYQYVRWQDVADRMNEAFGTSWSSEVMSQEILGNNVIVRVRVSIFDEDTKTFTSQEGFGGAINDDNMEAGNPFKAAYSKALKDACKKWGLALFLEEDGDSGTQMSHSTLPAGYMGKEYGVPPKSEPAARPEPVIETPTPVMQSTTGGLPTPPGVSMPTVKETVVVKQEAPTRGMPSIPSAPPVEHAVPHTAPSDMNLPPTPTSSRSLPTPPSVNLRDDMPMSKVSTINTGEPDKISDVQKAALHGILNLRNVDYETLVREAFEANGVVKNPIPPAEDLTYQEAVYVVKYGNDKFRRR